MPWVSRPSLIRLGERAAETNVTGPDAIIRNSSRYTRHIPRSRYQKRVSVLRLRMRQSRWRAFKLRKDGFLYLLALTERLTNLDYPKMTHLHTVGLLQHVAKAEEISPNSFSLIIIIIIIMGLESVSASEDVIGDLPSPWATINS